MKKITEERKDKELYMEVEYSTLVKCEDDELSWASIGMIEAEYEGKMIAIDFDETATAKLGKGVSGEQVLCYSNRSRHISEDFLKQYEDLGVDMYSVEAEKLARTSEIEELYWEVFRNDDEADIVPIMINSICFADETYCKTEEHFSVADNILSELNARLFKNTIEGMSIEWVKKELFGRGFECMIVQLEKAKCPSCTLFMDEDVDEEEVRNFIIKVPQIKGLIRTRKDALSQIEKMRDNDIEGCFLLVL